MADIKNYTDRIFHRVHRTGEELKNDLPNLIGRAVEAEIWKQTINPSTGKPFENVGQWLVANYPLGPAVGNGRFAIDYDDCITLCKNRPETKDLLVRHRPKRKNGRPVKEETVYNVNSLPKMVGNSRLYIEERLQRDHSEIWQAYLRGEYKSARQAGIAAGFIKDTHDPLLRLKSNWNRATKKQRAEFLKWMQELANQ